MDNIDFLGADRFSGVGELPVLIVNAADWLGPSVDIQAVIIGVDHGGALPRIDPAAFDLLITPVVDAPAPWVSVSPARMNAHVNALAMAVRAWPVAATLLARVLRLSEQLAVSAQLDVESLAYSTLLGGAEFARWRQARGAESIPKADAPLVLVERDKDMVTLTLNHPQTRNAMTAAMRDALYEALANTLDDPSAPGVFLKGAGKCFSTGGALEEFGTISDLAQAHVVRRVRCAAALLDNLGDRVSVHLHGACIGSGLEVPATAARRTASVGAWFQLPELRMGLIPGAGGTASVARAIGRHRTAWMLVSGQRIDARKALAWGLVHEVVA